MAVLFVTHDLAAARIVADRIAVMYLGRIVEIGPAGEVVAEPGTPIPRRSSRRFPRSRVRGAPGEGRPGKSNAYPPGCPSTPGAQR